MEKVNVLLLCMTLLLLALTFYMSFKKEAFDWQSTYLTDVTKTSPSSYYKVGTLATPNSSTINFAQNGGAVCSPYPKKIYIPVAPVDAVCKFDGSDQGENLYIPQSDNQANCTFTMKSGPLGTQTIASVTKTLTRQPDNVIDQVGGPVTQTAAMYGGKPCSQKYDKTVYTATKVYNCKGPIDAKCNLTDKTVYQDPGDSQTTCSGGTTVTDANGMTTISGAKKTLKIPIPSYVVANATTQPPYNGGKNCYDQAIAAGWPDSKIVPCGPVNASCKDVTSTVDTSYYNDLDNTSINPQMTCNGLTKNGFKLVWADWAKSCVCEDAASVRCTNFSKAYNYTREFGVTEDCQCRDETGWVL